MPKQIKLRKNLVGIGLALLCSFVAFLINLLQRVFEGFA